MVTFMKNPDITRTPNADTFRVGTTPWQSPGPRPTARPEIVKAAR